MKKRLALTRADWLALAVIALAAAIFFAPVWLGGRWLPQGGGDLTSLMWPNFRYASAMLKGGHLPLWNPHQFSGMPFWGDPQTALFYPPYLSVILLTDVPYQALEGLVIFHVALAGWLMYACLRMIRPEKPISPAPALAAALAWMFSDIFVTHIGNLNINAAAAWLPLVFLGAWRAFSDGTIKWSLLAGTGLGLSLLAGHAQVSYAIALAVSLASLILAITRLREGWKKALLPLGMATAIAVTGLGVSAATWIPAAELTRMSGRAALSYEEASSYSLPPEALIGLVAPWVYGRGPSDFTGNWDRVEVGYIGAVALALALAGAILGIRQRDKLAITLVIGATLAFLLALGRYAPLHRLAYEILPGMENFRAPARFILLFDFAAAILAALTIDSIRWPKSERWGGWALAGVIGAELVLNGMWVEVQEADPRTGFQHEAAISWLADQAEGPFRIDDASDDWQPHTAQFSGALYDISGFSQPLALADYQGVLWSLGRRGSRLYDFLGVKYVIGGEDPPGDDTFVPVTATESGVTIYLNTEAQPLAHLVGDAVIAGDSEEYWDAIHKQSWDPAEVVFVEGGPELDGSDLAGSQLGYLVYEPNRVSLSAVTTGPAYLLLAEPYYPGWAAEVNGERVKIYRANLAFRAIYLPEAGDYTVEMRYRPVTVLLGAIISIASAMMVGVYLTRKGVNQRREG